MTGDNLLRCRETPIAGTAFRLYFGLPLSARDIAAPLAERGIDAT